MIVTFCNIFGYLGNTIFSKNFTFDIYEEYTIQTLKCIIHEYFEYDVDTLRLSILDAEIELENEKTVNDYKNQIEGNTILIYGTLNCEDEFNTKYIPSNTSVNPANKIKQQLIKNKQIIEMFETLHEKSVDDITEILYEYPYLFIGLLSIFTDLTEKFCNEIPNYMFSMSVEDITHIMTVAYIFKEINKKINIPKNKQDLDMICLTREDYHNIIDIKHKLINIEEKDLEIIIRVYLITHKDIQLTIDFLE